jgi:hypothetical protein
MLKTLTFAEALAEAGESKANEIPTIVSWRKIISEDPVWYVTIKGSNEEMKITDVRDITDYRRFANQCVRQLSMFFIPVKQSAWAQMLIDARALLTEEHADEDTTLQGRFVELLEQFLLNRWRGQVRDDLLSGRPWEDESAMRHYFQMSPLMGFLEREGMRNLSRQDCIKWIDELGGGTKATTIRGKAIRLRWVPSGAVQETPELAPPKLLPETI